MRHATAAQAGTSLVECVAAVALAGLVLASIAGASRAAAAVVRDARRSSALLDVTRNLLEHELGAPCAPRPACPSGHDCSVSRYPIAASVDRVVVTVASSDGEVQEELATLAPAPDCSGG